MSKDQILGEYERLIAEASEALVKAFPAAKVTSNEISKPKVGIRRHEVLLNGKLTYVVTIYREHNDIHVNRTFVQPIAEMQS